MTKTPQSPPKIVASMMSPSKEEAWQFALMVQSGMPAIDAITYFIDSTLPATEIATIYRYWVGSSPYKAASLTLQGKPWQDMTLDERIHYSIDKHYTEMAYFLYSHNYSQLVGADRAKADTCRQALETKLAGMSGKMGPLEMFWQDIKTGKVKLAGLTQ